MGRGQPSILSTSSVCPEYKSKSWAKGWEPHPHLLFAGLKHSAWSPTFVRQVANQKVIQPVSTRSTAVPSQAAFADPNTSQPSQGGAGADPVPLWGHQLSCVRWNTLCSGTCWSEGRPFRPWFVDTMVNLHCLCSSFHFCSPLPSWCSWHLEKGGVLKALPVPVDSRMGKCTLTQSMAHYLCVSQVGSVWVKSGQEGIPSL